MPRHLGVAIQVIPGVYVITSSTPTRKDSRGMDGLYVSMVLLIDLNEYLRYLYFQGESPCTFSVN